MERHEIERLIRQAQAGNQIALGRLVEWGLDTVMLQYVEEGFLPLWVRVRLRRHLDERQRRRDTDFARGARVRAAHRAKVVKAVKAAAADIAARLRALPPQERAEYIEAQIDVKPGHYGLRKTPSLELIQSILNQKI